MTRLQRARGIARAGFRLRGAQTVLAELYQAGSAKAMRPRSYGDAAHVVFVNTAGGITGGDEFAYQVEAGEGADVVATTQAAERVYRASEGVGRLETTLKVERGASLAWLPLETILFEGGRLERQLEVEMAADARLFALESVVFGRKAMGEVLRSGLFRDAWRIRRGGELVYADTLRLGGDLATLTARPASFGGARAAATLVHVAPEAEDRLEQAREILAGLAGVEAAASAWNGLMVLRFLAPDNAPLRTAITEFLTRFRGTGLPRVWHM